jgi:hypothetical protein
MATFSILAFTLAACFFSTWCWRPGRSSAPAATWILDVMKAKFFFENCNNKQLIVYINKLKKNITLSSKKYSADSSQNNSQLFWTSKNKY